jgi:hypothetical protein
VIYMPARKAGKSRKSGKPALKSRATSKKPAKKRASAGPKDKRPSLLILECDAEKLAKQSLAIGSDVHELIGRWAPGVIRTELVRTASEVDLLEQLGRAKEKHGRFDLVLVVGHSNPQGLCLTAERFVPWGVFAKWIEIFEPKKVLLVACEAGRWLAAKAIFDGVPKLKEVYASPVVMNRHQATAVLLLVFYFLLVKSPDAEHVQMIQAINLFRSGGLLYRWTRKECKDEGLAEGVKWDVLSHLKESLFRRGVYFNTPACPGSSFP